MGSFIDMLREQLASTQSAPQYGGAPTSFPANESPSQFTARQQASGYSTKSAMGGVESSPVQADDVLTLGGAAEIPNLIRSGARPFVEKVVTKGIGSELEPLHRLASKTVAGYRAFDHASDMAGIYRAAAGLGGAEGKAAARLAEGVEADNPLVSRLGAGWRAFHNTNPIPAQKEQWFQSLAQDVAQSAKSHKALLAEQLQQKLSKLSAESLAPTSPVASKILDFAEKTAVAGKKK